MLVFLLAKSKCRKVSISLHRASWSHFLMVCMAKMKSTAKKPLFLHEKTAFYEECRQIYPFLVIYMQEHYIHYMAKKIVDI